MSKRHPPEEFFPEPDLFAEPKAKATAECSVVVLANGAKIHLRGLAAEGVIRSAQPPPAPDAAHARTTDPATSHAAAASVKNQRSLRARILVQFSRLGPMTDEKLLASWPSDWRGTPSGIRTRRSELVRDGLLVDSLKRELLESHREAIVWRIP